MKKYIKPAIYYESFELSQNISACGFDMDHTESRFCVAYGDPYYGNDGMTILGSWCYDGLDPDADGDIYCYENGSTTMDEAFRVFNS